METIKLDLIPGKKMPSLHASQYDDGREHGIDLFENGVVYKLDGTETLTINERKGDDCICSLDIENTFADTNHIVFASTEQMCAVWGNNICELVIAKGEKTIGTLNFILEIEQSPTEGGIESESEIKNLKRQIEAITEEVIGEDYYTKTQTDEAIATAIEDKADTTYVDTELAKKADKTDTYTKSQTDNLLNDKADVSDLPDMSQYYDKSEVDDLLDDKANSDDVYGKAYIDTALSGKANVGTSYTKSEEDALLDDKADKSDTYTKEQVDDIVYNILPDDTASGSVANFETDLALPLKSLEVDVNAVQSGTGDPSPDNVRPISGWSSVNVTRTGKNLLPSLSSAVTVNHITFSPLSDGAIDINGTASGNASIDVGRNERCFLQAGTYYVNITATPYTITVFGMVNGTVATIKNGGGLFTLTKPTQIFVRVVIASGTSVNHFRLPLQLELGSTATDYEAYNGTTEVINLGGTYYGGVLDVVMGKLRVTHGMLIMNTLSWRYSSNIFKASITTAKDENNIIGICNKYNYHYVAASQLKNYEFRFVKDAYTLGKVDIFLVDNNYTDANTFRNSLSDAVLVYELATPIEVQLTPQQIEAIVGTNNIYADTGDTSVVFKDSVNGYVEKKLASVQALALNT